MKNNILLFLYKEKGACFLATPKDISIAAERVDIDFSWVECREDS
jgi:hypothetical protein